MKTPKYYIDRYRSSFGEEQFSVMKKGSTYHYGTFNTYDEAKLFLNKLITNNKCYST